MLLTSGLKTRITFISPDAFVSRIDVLAISRSVFAICTKSISSAFLVKPISISDNTALSCSFAEEENISSCISSSLNMILSLYVVRPVTTINCLRAFSFSYFAFSSTVCVFLNISVETS